MRLLVLLRLYQVPLTLLMVNQCELELQMKPCSLGSRLLSTMVSMEEMARPPIRVRASE